MGLMSKGTKTYAKEMYSVYSNQLSLYGQSNLVDKIMLKKMELYYNQNYQVYND